MPDHQRSDDGAKRAVYVELLAAGVIFVIVIVVLAMIFLYKPAG